VLLKYESDVHRRRCRMSRHSSPMRPVRTSSADADERESASLLFARRAERVCGSLRPKAIDALRAVAEIGLSDRSILRDTFLLTPRQERGRKEALGACFDLFFAQPEIVAAFRERSIRGCHSG